MQRVLPHIKWNIKAVANAIVEVNKQTAFMRDRLAPIPTVLSTKSIGNSFDEIREASGIYIPNVIATQSSVNNALTLINYYIVTDTPFDALIYDPVTFEMLGVKVGWGDVTSTHAGIMYALDYQNNPQVFPADAQVWEHGRVVDNPVTDYDDISGASEFVDPILDEWVYVTDGEGGTVTIPNKTTVVVTGGTAGILNYQAFGYVGNATSRFRCRLLSGEVLAATSAVFGYVGDAFNLTEEWQTISVTQYSDGGGGGLVGIGMSVLFANGGSFEITDATFSLDDEVKEFVADRTVFATTNNTVVDPVTKVVTDSVGELFDPAPMLVHEGFSDAAQTIPATSINSFDAANHSNTKGGYYLEAECGTENSDLISLGSDVILKTVSVNAELFTPFSSIGTGWVDHGDGSYSADGSQAADSDLRTIDYVPPLGTTLEYTIHCSNVSGVSFAYLYSGAPVMSPLVEGENKAIHTSENTSLFIIRAKAGSVIDIDSVSIKEVNADLILTDGTNAASILITKGTHKIGAAFDADAGTMALNVDGVWSADTGYDGSFGSGDIALGANSRELKRGTFTTLSEQKTMIDDLMS